MELREKPGKVQKLLELSLRFRLIFVLLMVGFSVAFLATGWQQMGSLPLGASEALGMWISKFTNVVSAWNSAQYIFVAGLSMIVLYFVFGGVRGGVGGLLALAAFVGALFALGGDEDMLIVFFAAFAGIALLLVLFAKWSVACALFPFALSWLLLTGFLAWFPMMVGKAWLMWAVLSTIAFSGVVAFALIAGKELGEGAPQAGALVKAGKRMLAPVPIASLLAISALVVDMSVVVDWRRIGCAALLWVAFNVWFFGFTFGTMSFAPWERLRSGSRRVKMSDKKKKSAKKK
ncbi:hypothetical protein [Fibrobacter sp. UWB12]|uniref:hypothetical protein n=1 Tax=Fibrobacter sp. UWB12 TaxID=1896203 RepID=UPI00091329F9|nr:hypothetical protein [Fibrobacter sp. UWB12]SHK59154.1 hypothetical protein SAMN05720759_10478 [Fibrobacter sp. UWB12]